jgi:hypothetical protein
MVTIIYGLNLSGANATSDNTMPIKIHMYFNVLNLKSHMLKCDITSITLINIPSLHYILCRDYYCLLYRKIFQKFQIYTIENEKHLSAIPQININISIS